MITEERDVLAPGNGLDEQDFVASFEALTLPDAAFRHPDHVRLAWIYLRRLPLLEAIERYRSGSQAFASAHGAPGKYHETITWAFLVLVNERMQRSGRSGGWEAFAADNEDLLRFRDGALFDHYDPEVIDCPVARSTFVLPRAR